MRFVGTGFIDIRKNFRRRLDEMLVRAILRIGAQDKTDGAATEAQGQLAAQLKSQQERALFTVMVTAQPGLPAVVAR